jgi:hypothetical protein
MIKTTPIQFSLLILSLCIGCSTQPQVKEDSVENNKQQLTFTEDGAWCWFSDPRAVYHQGKHKRTYSGWVTADGSIEVGYYDHDLDTVITSIIDEKLQVDDHNNPSFIMDRQGRLMVFYSKHSAKSPMILARATSPEDIDVWEDPRELVLNDSTLFPDASNTYTYTNIVRLSEEDDKLFLFWRGVDFKPNFATSSDHGNSWSGGKILILPERTYRNRRPYLKIGTNNRNVIHFAFTDGHPRNEPTNSIYYAKYQNGELHKANNSKIKSWSELPLDPAESDLVYDAKDTGEKAWIWDVAGDSEDNPVLVYSRFPNDTTHVYYYACWNGDQWLNTKLVDSGKWFPETPDGKEEREPNYSGGITLDHSNPSIVYLSTTRNGIFEIERWETRDLGHNWDVTPITVDSKQNNIRPFVVRNSHQVMWLNLEYYRHYTDYGAAVRMALP